MATPELPYVSVILPCYNGDKYLEDAVNSVLRQSFEDFELIVVDDGSTDNSAAILQRLAAQDSRLKILTQKNGGIVSALNAGLAASKGSYVARMDADDVSFAGRFNAQVEILDRNPDVVLVGGFAVSDEIPSSASVRTTGGVHTQTDLTVFPPKVAVSMHPLIMVRRSALDQIGGYRTDYRHAEDYDLFLRLGTLGRFLNPPIDMLFYRRHEGAISVRNVEEQENSAVRAEIDAIVSAGLQPQPEWVVSAYTRLRIWRRYSSVNPVEAKRMLPLILSDLLIITPCSLTSLAYLKIRLMIIANLKRFLIRRLRHRPINSETSSI